MGCQQVKTENLAALIDAISDARRLARQNCIFGHALVFLSVLGAVGVGMLAYSTGSKEASGTLDNLRLLFLTLALLPTLVSMAEKALKPAEWEAWYARKALALEAILRHARSDNPTKGGPTSDGALPTAMVNWWNNVDNEFEKSRPSWGIPEALEAKAAEARSRDAN